MNKKLVIPTALFIVVLIFSFFALAQAKPKAQAQADKPTDQTGQQASQIILFYGDGCPHCALVEEYVNQNGVEAQISFAKKEVYYN